jgi:acetate kinase
MADLVLVLNAGSSSLKFSAYEIDAPGGEPLGLRLSGQVEAITTAPRFKARDAHGTEIASQQWAAGDALGHDGAVRFLAGFLQQHGTGHRLRVVGHRVVHGGMRFTRPVRVTPEIVAELATLSPLAPLHQPHNLKPIEVLAASRPELPQVACFDTAFHRTQPEVAQAYALPPAITDRGVRRYGFHGLSYEYIASVLADHDARAAAGRTVVAHLGNGCSMCGLVGARSVSTSMGFTAVDGLPMGTRTGSLDPGVVVYLMDELGMDARAIERLIYQQSGLLGVSGLSSDMRTLLASDDDRARFAIELFCYRVARELGSLAAATGGLDALVFTAGIGEHAAPIRERVVRASAWLGVALDEARNAAGGPRISTDASAVTAWVIPTNEELMIARHALEALKAA